MRPAHPWIHPSDGTDPEGRELDVVIRIAPDGRVFLHDITADLIPVALALNPGDPALVRRAEAAKAFQAKEKP
jgi:hypothetical protein